MPGTLSFVWLQCKDKKLVRTLSLKYEDLKDAIFISVGGFSVSIHDIFFQNGEAIAICGHSTSTWIQITCGPIDLCKMTFIVYSMVGALM